MSLLLLFVGARYDAPKKSVPHQPQLLTADRQGSIVISELLLTEQMMRLAKKKPITDDEEVLELFAIIYGGTL